MLALRKSVSVGRGRRLVILASVTCLAMTGCGMRISHDRVVAASGAGQSGTVVDPLTGAPVDPGAPVSGLPGASGPTGTTGNVGPLSPGPTSGSVAPVGPGTPGKPGTSRGSGGGAAGVCKGTGTILLGNVAPYGASAVGQNFAPGRDALKIWETDVNNRGGICGRKVKVFAVDDGGNASRTSAAMRDLVENKHVVAIVAWGTALTMQAGLGYLEQKQIPVLGGDLLGMGWSSSPIMFPEGAGFDEAIYGALTSSKRPGAANKMALFYCAEAQSCADANDLVTRQGIGKAAGTPVVYTAKVSLTAVSFASECQQAKQAGADIVLMGGDASFVERIANSCAQQGIQFRYTTVSLAVQDGQSQNPNFQNGNFAVATPVIPWPSTATPGAKEYSAAYHRYYPDLVNSGTAMSWWASGKLAEAVISRIGSGAVTPASILAAARGLRNETLNGLTGPLSFGSGGAARGQGSPRCYYTVEVRNNKWVARDNGKLHCRSGPPLTKEGGGTR
ncbi:MAG: hypothetical protein JWN87_1350 [Frankiales bacterium]|nr:hypothetical protein [Frankiales bacterium]